MRIGFIGVGNMGYAMLSGVVSSGFVSADDVWASNKSSDRLDMVRDDFGVNVTSENRELVKNCDVVIVAVKPNVIDGVLKEISDCLRDGCILVSVAAGFSIEDIENCVGNSCKVCRVMPNTPCLVGEGMSAICRNENVSDDDLNVVEDIFSCFGKCEVIDESLMDCVMGVSGSSPAYVFMFMEAMADAAVLSGMKMDMAYEFVGQSVLGAAKMLLETGKHPGELKDMVCSPAGTTIKAVEVLERYGLRNAVIQGQLACVEKSKEMNEKR